MEIAMIGMGRMGMNMARRLLRAGHKVYVYNRTPEKSHEMVEEGAVGLSSLLEVSRFLSRPRAVWLMLPAGPLIDEHLLKLEQELSEGDVVVDGGNSFYKDALRRGTELGNKGIRFLDVGVSGGIWGLELGYCLMIGGPREAYEHLKPLFEALAPKEGFLYCGACGAGHFVKMLHNGIEYGLMQAYGEGLEILKASPYGDSLKPSQIAHLWNQGSVIRSWLLELAETAFMKDESLSQIRGFVEDSGEGRWTIQQAIESGVSAPVITLALMQRFRSQKQDTFSDRVVAALRREFGGHSVVLPEPRETPLQKVKSRTAS